MRPATVVLVALLALAGGTGLAAAGGWAMTGDPGWMWSMMSGGMHRGGMMGSGPSGPPPRDPLTVAMRNTEFLPSEIHVKVGQTVTWVNQDPVAHTVTADDGAWDSGLLAQGARFSRTFSAPGTYAYHCAPHSSEDASGAWMGMVGTVVVEG